MKKKIQIPDQTPGAKLARATRVAANKLSDDQREKLFREGMTIIYGGGKGKKAVTCDR
jgi:hypothetical protein